MGRQKSCCELLQAWRFDAAREVFNDAFAIDRLDDRDAFGEPRFVTIGMVDGRLLLVAYTMRGDTIRIISVRGAEPREQRQYYEDQR
jgi:uncharacterized protein